MAATISSYIQPSLYKPSEFSYSYSELPSRVCEVPGGARAGGARAACPGGGAAADEAVGRRAQRPHTQSADRAPSHAQPTAAAQPAAPADKRSAVAQLRASFRGDRGGVMSAQATCVRSTYPVSCNSSAVSASGGAGGGGKRKSAVELLAETKAFYVKSETVRDRKQELPLRVGSGLSQAIAAGGCQPVSSTIVGSAPPHYSTVSPVRTSVGRARVPAPPDALQSKLRRLLEHSDSRENVCLSPIDYTKREQQNRHYYDSRKQRGRRYESAFSGGNFSGNSSSGTSGSKGQIRSDPEHSRTSSGSIHRTGSCSRPSSSGDNRIFFPDSFIVPPPRPAKSDPVNLFFNSFSIESSFSSPECQVINAQQMLSFVEDLDATKYTSMGEVLNEAHVTEDFTAISPPAEYAVPDKCFQRYVRSNSHSQPRTEQEYNINSHKSLPDLHMQTKNYPGPDGMQSPPCPTSPSSFMNRDDEGSHSIRGSRRHSSHHTSDRQDADDARSQGQISNYSKGTTSNRSSVISSSYEGCGSRPSPQYDNSYSYNRSGSSFARDSGGSSGRCTQRSAPPHRNDRQAEMTRTRRAPQVVLQDVHNPNYAPICYDVSEHPSPTEWPLSAPPPQFQDPAPAFRHYREYRPRTTKDGYKSHESQQYFSYAGVDSTEAHRGYTIPIVRQDGEAYDHGYRSAQAMRRDSSGSGAATASCDRADGSSGSSHSRQGPLRINALSPDELGNFRRQRCLRYKRGRTPPTSQQFTNKTLQRADTPEGLRSRPILRSKSDISDRYWRVDSTMLSESPSNNGSRSVSSGVSAIMRVLPDAALDSFFERLGLDDRSYEAVLNDGSGEDTDSQIFFSDVSTVDSNQMTFLNNGGDYTVQGPQQTSAYRNSEPPSIVERNARIIKWLCNCRKLQPQATL